jgi:hypothetical protein
MIQDPSDEEVNWGHSSRLTHSPVRSLFFRAMNTKIRKTEEKCSIEGSSVEFLFFRCLRLLLFGVHGMGEKSNVKTQIFFFLFPCTPEKFMVLWPEASNNGNCFRREHFYRPIWSWSEGDANKLSFLSAACFVYWSNTVSTREKKSNNSEMKLHFFCRYKKAVCAKLILLFKTSDMMTAKLFHQNMY